MLRQVIRKDRFCKGKSKKKGQSVRERCEDCVSLDFPCAGSKTTVIFVSDGTLHAKWLCRATLWHAYKSIGERGGSAIFLRCGKNPDFD